MAAREESSTSDVRSGHDPDDRDCCAPIRQTIAGELDGLYRFAMARLRHNAHMAEDAVQQALLIAMAHPSPPSEVQAQHAWLRGIVHNVIRRQVRSLRRGRQAIHRAPFERHDGGRSDADAAAPHAEDGRNRMVQALYLAVTDLNQAEQDLFYAFYRAGRSHACIAAELGTTSKGVEARLYRLRSRLRTALERCGERLS